MDTSAFGTEWPSTRATLQRLATHVFSQARQRHDQLFDLCPSPGGFSTPVTGPARERVRLAGDSLLIERAAGLDIRQLDARTTAHRIDGASIAGLCGAIGFEPDPSFWVGADTPPLGDPEAPIRHDAVAAVALGEWYLLGQATIDAVIGAHPDSAASVGRLWPEHFDYGIDLAVDGGRRVNLGAAAGDGFHEAPYLYVGPWTIDGVGSSDYWNAPFGAVIGVDQITASANPYDTAVTFFTTGLEYLRQLPSD